MIQTDRLARFRPILMPSWWGVKDYGKHSTKGRLTSGLLIFGVDTGKLIIHPMVSTCGYGRRYSG